MLKKVLLGLVGLAVALYVAACAYLFATQRSAIYHPRPATAAPAGYVAMDVDVPGVGVLHEYRLPTAGQPTLVFFHGNAGSAAAFAELGRKLHFYGWGIVLAEYPGYSGNPGKPTEDNLMAAARATISAVHGSRVVVWGHSLGSGVAARMASEGRATGLVLESPFTSLPDVAAGIYPYIPVRLLMLDRFDTKSQVDKIKVPVLIFHSVDDPVIPFAMGEALKKAFGPRAVFVAMQGVGHYPHGRDLSEIFMQWVDRCLLHDCPRPMDG